MCRDCSRLSAIYKACKLGGKPPYGKRSFDKIIFSDFQVSSDRERWLTASVRDFTLCGILLKSLFSCNSESITTGHMRDHSTGALFVSCRQLTGFAVTLVDTYSETDSI